MKIEFFMPMKPPTITHQEKQVHVVNNKPVFYEPAELKVARSKLMANLAKHVPAEKYTGAVQLVVKWCFPRGKHKDGSYKTTKPDTDNLNKLLKDCMSKCGYWTDDALVASEIVEKFWAEMPGIYIAIKTIGTCMWLHDEVCCNSSSDECADFPDEDVCDRCKYFEVKS